MLYDFSHNDVNLQIAQQLTDVYEYLNHQNSIPVIYITMSRFLSISKFIAQLLIWSISRAFTLNINCRYKVQTQSFQREILQLSIPSNYSTQTGQLGPFAGHLQPTKCLIQQFIKLINL
jgi:hypothetical protein